MSAIAKHIRITGLQYVDSDVDARTSAANSLKVSWKKVNDVPSIVKKAQDVATALVAELPPAALGLEVQVAIQKKASAFLYEDRPLEVGVVAGVAAHDLIAGLPPALSGWTIGDVWAASLWSALSFHLPLNDPKREALRLWILESARKRVIDGANTARQRVDVPDIVDAEPEDTVNLKFLSQTKHSVEALRRNSALDREELDFLWWALAGRSRLLSKRLTALSEPTRLVAAAIDASDILRRLPCDVHRELVLRNVETDPELDLADLIAELDDSCSLLASPFDDLVPKAPMVFPVLSAMLAGVASSGSGSAIKRKSSEWGQRVLLEAALCKIYSLGPKNR